MMQIVHDLAPGSPLDFATAFTSEPSFAANITALANQGAKVIIDDVTYFDEPMYQDGIVEQAITGVRARGVDYFTSSANNRYRQERPRGRLLRGGQRLPADDLPGDASPGHADCHNFGTAGAPDSTFGFTLRNGQTSGPILDWAEPWNGGVNTDLDLYLIDETTNSDPATAAPVNAASRSQQAFEFFAGSPCRPTTWPSWWPGSPTRPRGTPRFKMVFAENGANPFNDPGARGPGAGTGDVMGPTAFGHNGGADAMSVGASDVRVATNLNSYSSYGPVTTLFGPVDGGPRPRRWPRRGS